MKLIHDWKTAYRMFSVQALAVVGALQSLSLVFPSAMGHHVPFLTGVTWADGLSAVTASVAALGIVGRLIAQGDPAA